MMRTTLLRSAGVLAVLACTLAGALAVEAWRARHDDPLTHPEFTALMAQVVTQPGDKALRERLRDLDEQLRGVHAARALRLQRGGWALAGLGGLAVLCVALARLGRVVPYDPRGRPPPDPWRGAALARRGVVGAAALLAGWATFSVGCGTAPVRTTPLDPTAAAAAAAPPTAAEFAANWPCFRGPRGDGSTATPWPATRRERWRVPAGLPGASSPILWGGSIYLTGSDGKRQTITAFDAASGAQRWQAEVPWPPGARPEAFAETGFAAPTPVSDGRQVAAIFASGAFIAVDCADGRQRWLKQFGVPASSYSYAASLALWQDRVFVQWDVDDEGRSALSAHALASGRELWTSKRDLTASWSSPVVASLAGRVVVLTAGNPRLAAYDAASGAELWRADLYHGDVGPSPIAAGDRAIFANAQNLLAVLKPDGSTAWQGEDGLPDMVSPASDGKQVALVSDGGTLTAYALSDGAKAWEEHLGGIYRASPLLHGSSLLLFDADGQGREAKLGPACVLGEPWPVGGQVSASPAVVDGRLYVRTHEHLVCYESEP